jgi:acetoacetyl-CoA synthetase
MTDDDDAGAALAAQGYGATLWEPDAKTIAGARISRYARWLAGRGVDLGGDPPRYQDLWEWSVTSPGEFWTSVWDYFDVLGDRGDGPALTGGPMPGTAWFPGATLNYARNALRAAWTDPERPAVVFSSERGRGGSLTYAELAAEVARVAAGLRALGVARGDRVVALLPNIPEAVIGLLATASIGAIWSSCSPDFGTRSVVDRFAQIEPAVLLAVDGYTYNGKDYPRGSVVAEIAAQLPTLKAVVMVDLLGTAQASPPALPAAVRLLHWTALGVGTPDETPDECDSQPPIAGSVSHSSGQAGQAGQAGMAGRARHAGHAGQAGEAGPAGRAREPEFEEVPFGHPLWVLYSSGTTGLPKAIVHGHGGIVLEHLKALALHLDLHPGDRFTWYTTTGWMMWNFLAGGLLVGATIVLYDGSATYPETDRLWRLAAEERLTYLGVGAPYLMACQKAGLTPGQAYDLSALRGVGSTGSPLPPEGFTWVYDAVGKGVQLGSMSGGTDVCTAFVGHCPLLPVRSGIISGRCLGAKVESFDSRANPVTGKVGELVITGPMPSMPVMFWNDPGGKKYADSYFAVFPGVWRHGDWIEILADGGCVIFGRSDATLNRGGVRMGTSEFYRVVESFPEVTDSLVVDTGRLGADGRLVLFVQLAPGRELDDDLAGRIRAALRKQLSPRHVPDEIVSVPGVPRTLSGKKLEIPVRKILQGTPVTEAADPSALANPEVLAAFEGLRGGVTPDEQGEPGSRL